LVNRAPLVVEQVSGILHAANLKVVDSSSSEISIGRDDSHFERGESNASRAKSNASASGGDDEIFWKNDSNDIIRRERSSRWEVDGNLHGDSRSINILIRNKSEHPGRIIGIGKGGRRGS